MTRRMSGRRENSHAAVAKNVAIPFQLGGRMLRFESWRAFDAGPFILGLLNVEHGGRKHFDIPDVVGMGVRDGYRLDVGRFDPELIQLSCQGFWAVPEHGPRIGRREAIWHGRDLIGDARIPQEPALRMLDEIATVDEAHRFALVDARRPSRNIAGDTFAAIDDVEPFDAGLARLGVAEID